MTVSELKQKFIDIYGGGEKELRVFASPGRVNLIGEHTDYNGGYVFPAALSLNTTIILRKREDGLVNLAVTDLDDRVTIDVNNLEKYKSLRWGNYQAGVIAEVKKAGHTIVGCDLLYDDTVPHGSGLSSSAAIEVATALAFATLSNERKGIGAEVDMIEMALLSQRAENKYVGVSCGIMDQFASAMGKKNHAIFLNCRDLSFRLVPLELKGYKIVLSNTNKKRSLAVSKYNERRSECETGLKILQKALPEKSCLGEITLDEWNAHKRLIKNETIAKRVEHVICEDDRVLRCVKALEKSDIAEFGKLMVASHTSLRDLYEVTGGELDTLVEEALKVEGVIGSRMTGAGFGGCTVSIVREESVDIFKQRCGEEYTKKIGYSPSFYVSDIGDGGREVL